MKPIKPGNRIRHRALLLAAVPLTAVLAGGVAVAATSGSNSPAPPGTATTQQDRDRARDGSCLDSPTAVPGATAQHMYEHRYQHGDDATDR